MKYLKVVNTPLRGLFPEKKGRAIDWLKAGFNPTDVMRFQAQGYDAVVDGNFVSVFPIADEIKLRSCAAIGILPEPATIINRVNDNPHFNDIAEIISEAEAEIVKTMLTSIREQIALLEV